MTNRLIGTVSPEGRLKLANLAGWRGLLKHLAGKKVILTIGEFKKDRSSNENRYYWGIVVKMLGDELGYQAEEMHEALKFKFLRLEAEPDGKRALETVRSTTSLKTDEFEDYLDRIRMWAATDMGIVIPRPNEIEGLGL